MSKTTFIIPVKVESHDRARNLEITAKYLLSNTSGELIIKEVDTVQRVPEILGDMLSNSRITYLFEEHSGAFHRTKYLNDMLQLVKTSVVSNYDVDVLLPPSAYELAEKMIAEGDCDVVYPYPHSQDGQYMLFLSDATANLLRLDPNYENAISVDKRTCPTFAGHCFFIRTSDYKKAGGEMEEFISYGPEDGERIARFEKLELRLKRLDSKVLHMEHYRTPDSSTRNPHFRANCDLEKKMKGMNKTQMQEYIKSLPHMELRGWL